MNSLNRNLIQIPITILISALLTYVESKILNSKFNFDIFFINCIVFLITIIIMHWQKLQLIKKVLKSIYKPTYKMKIGLDIHHCIDYDTVFFSELSRTLIANGHEVHITTGSMITDKLKEELVSYGMKWTNLWSISDYYKSKPGIEMWYDEKGRPWVDDELWDMAKGDYAKLNNLDLTLDDTERYKKYFSTSVAICNIVNKSKKTKEEKAVMPLKPSLIKKVE